METPLGWVTVHLVLLADYQGVKAAIVFNSRTLGKLMDIKSVEESREIGVAITHRRNARHDPKPRPDVSTTMIYYAQRMVM